MTFGFRQCGAMFVGFTENISGYQISLIMLLSRNWQWVRGYGNIAQQTPLVAVGKQQIQREGWQH